jgi:hypothetical protein
MDWWEEALLELPSSPSSFTADDKEGEDESGVRLRVACTPSQHGSGRGAGDQNCSLWCSWALGLEKEGAQQQDRQPGEEQKDSLPTDGGYTASNPIALADPVLPPTTSSADDDTIQSAQGEEGDKDLLVDPVPANQAQPNYLLAASAELKETHAVWGPAGMDWKCFFAGFALPFDSTSFLSNLPFGVGF